LLLWHSEWQLYHKTIDEPDTRHAANRVQVKKKYSVEESNIIVFEIQSAGQYSVQSNPRAALRTFFARVSNHSKA